MTTAVHQNPRTAANASARSAYEDNETTGVRRAGGSPAPQPVQAGATQAWGSVFAGLATAIGAESLLAVIGVAVGATGWSLGLYAFPAGFSFVTGIYLVASVSVAMLAAGYVAARNFRQRRLADAVVATALTWSTAVAAAGLLVWSSILWLGLPTVTQLATTYVRFPVGVAWYAVGLAIVSLISAGAGSTLANLDS